MPTVTPRFYHQYPPLIQKNFLWYFSSPLYLTLMLISVFIGFLSVLSSVKIYFTLYSEDQVANLFPPEQFSLGPRSLCERFASVQALPLLTQPGSLADQMLFNIDSINEFHSKTLPSGGITSSNHNSNNNHNNNHNNTINQSAYLSSQSCSHPQHDTFINAKRSPENNNTTSSNPVSWPNQVVTLDIIDDYMSNPDLQSITPAKFAIIIQYTESTTKPSSLSHKEFKTFNYLMHAWRTYVFPLGQWFSSSTTENAYNIYTNRFSESEPINQLVPLIQSLIEFSIAQINGFYPDVPLCDFDPGTFELSVFSYPTSYTTYPFIQDDDNAITGLAAYAASMIFLLPITLFIITNTIREKTNHIHASLLIIGIYPTSIHFTTFISLMLLFTPVVLIASAVAWIFASFWAGFVLFFYFYTLLAFFITFSRLLASFFTNLSTSQVGSVLAMILIFIVGTISINASPLAYTIQFYLLPTTPLLTFFKLTSFTFLQFNQSLQFSDITYLVPHFPHSALGILGVSALQSVAMLLLGVYFDSILNTSQYHIPKPWYYPFTDLGNICRFVLLRVLCCRWKWIMKSSIYTIGDPVDVERRHEMLAAATPRTNMNHSAIQRERERQRDTNLARNRNNRPNDDDGGGGLGNPSQPPSLYNSTTNQSIKSHNSTTSAISRHTEHSNHSHTPSSSHHQLDSHNTSIQSSQSILESIDEPIDEHVFFPNPFETLFTQSLSDFNQESDTEHPPHKLTHRNSTNQLSSTFMNPFDLFTPSQQPQRYFLQYGNDDTDRLWPDQEYLFSGHHKTSQSPFIRSTPKHQASQKRSKPLHSQQESNLHQSTPLFLPNPSTDLFASDSSLLTADSINNNNPQPSNRRKRNKTGNMFKSQKYDLPFLQDPAYDEYQRHNSSAGNLDDTYAKVHLPIIQPANAIESTSPSITLKNITKTFQTSSFLGLSTQTNTALEINLRLYSGQINSIIGRNASGKSLLLSILAGMLEPTEGSVFRHLPNAQIPTSAAAFSNQNNAYNLYTSGGLDTLVSTGSFDWYQSPVEKMEDNPLRSYQKSKSASEEQDKTAFRPTYGVCWQEDTLFEELTCFQNLELFSLFKESVSGHHLTREQRLQEISQFMEMAQLSSQYDGKEDAKVNTLSGGQKRKLNLSICLMHNPQIVLLDQCTTGADPNAQNTIWNMLELQKKKRTIILVTHNFAEALIGDRISILKDGKLVCNGSAQFLKEHYKVGEYIFTIDKQPFVDLDPALFTHAAAKLDSGTDQTNITASSSLQRIGSNASASRSELIRETSLQSCSQPVTVGNEDEYNPDVMKSITFAPPAPSVQTDEGFHVISPTLRVNLHAELMSIKIEEIGFDIKSMLSLISDSNLTLSYTIQPNQEANIPLLLDYLETHRDSLWIKGTSLTSTSLDDVFRRAHEDNYVDETDPFDKPNSSDDPEFDRINSVMTPDQPLSSKPNKPTQPSELQPPTLQRFVSSSSSSSSSSSIQSRDDIFAHSEWYNTHLPRVESKYKLFFTFTRAFLYKRIMMLFFHFSYAIPLFLLFCVVTSSPAMFYYTFPTYIEPAVYDLDYITRQGGQIQFFAPKNDQVRYSPSTNLPNSAISPLSSQSQYATKWWDQVNNTTSPFSPTSLESIPADLNSPHAFLSRSLTSTKNSKSAEVQIDDFERAGLSANDIQAFLLEQSLHSQRIRPHAISAILRSANIIYNNEQHQLFGSNYFDLKPPSPKQFRSTKLYNDGDATAINSQPSAPPQYGLVDLSSSVYVNTTSHLLLGSYIKNYYAMLATVHNNIQTIFTDSKTSPQHNDFNHSNPHSQSTTPLNNTQAVPSTLSITPTISELSASYTTTARASRLLSHQSDITFILNATPPGITAFLAIVIPMFIVFTYHKEREIKVFDLHRLAGGTMATIAYHTANIIFDCFVAIFLISSSFLVIHVAFRTILPYTQSSIYYMPWDLFLHRGLPNLAIYLTIVAVCLPFQSYLALALSTSINGAYFISLTWSFSPILTYALAQVIPRSISPFFYMFGSTSPLLGAMITESLAIWSPYAYDDDEWPLLTFQSVNLYALTTVLIGLFLLFITEIEFSPSDFTNVASIRTFLSGFLPPSSLRPQNPNTKTDQSVKDMKRDILAMQVRTGLQTSIRDQYAVILYGLRKVYEPPARWLIFQIIAVLLKIFNEVFNPLLPWWRRTKIIQDTTQLQLEDLRFRSMRREKRRQRRAAALQTAKNAPHAVNNELIDFSDDDDDDDDATLDHDLAEFLSKKSTLQGTTVALNDLYLAVRKNAVTCLAGGNGSGKSSFFSILANETTPSASCDPISVHTAFIHGSSILERRSHQSHSRISYCPQSNRLNEELSARQHFRLYATLYAIESHLHESLIARVLYSLDLSHVADIPCSQYSPGQLRLTMLGVSLLCNSDIVLLDEFSNFLDPIARSNVHHLIKALSRTRTIILASHLADEIEHLGDDVGIIAKGNLVAVGSKSTLKSGDNQNDSDTTTTTYARMSTLVYTVTVRVESPQVLMSILAFILTTLARIPTPNLSHSHITSTSPVPLKQSQIFHKQLQIWNEWLAKCHAAGVKVAAQKQDRFLLHVNTDLYPISTLFTRLEQCKVNSNGKLVRYTASQPNVDQLFLKVLEQSNTIVGESYTKENFDLGSRSVL